MGLEAQGDSDSKEFLQAEAALRSIGISRTLDGFV